MTPAAGSDIAVDGVGGTDGYHVRIAGAATAFQWSDLAILRPQNLDEQDWYGYQCVSGDSKYVAVTVLPASAENLSAGREHGAYAFSVSVATGAVVALGSGFASEYFSPGCGVDGTAVFSASLGSDEQTTQLVRYDLATGQVVFQTTVKGQVTSAVPTPSGIVGVDGSEVVLATAAGDIDHPADIANAASLDGELYSVRARADGGVDLLSADGKGTSTAWELDAAGNKAKAATGKTDTIALDSGRGGRNLIVNAAKTTSSSSLTSVSTKALATVPAVVSLGGAAAFAPEPVKLPKDTSTKVGDAPKWDAGVVESTSSHKKYSAAVKQNAVAVPPVTSSGPVLPGLPTPERNKLAPSDRALGGAATSGESVRNLDGSALKAQAPMLSPGATTPTCGVARLDPTLQPMQNSNTQAGWAVQMAEQGLLTGSSYTRPANYANMGLVAYAPSSDFPPVSLEHPSGDSWNTVPRSVMEAIMAQESNLNQASWHALPGIAGDPLIADYYGAGDSIDDIDYPDADCGYGITQLTTGMAADDGSISQHGKMKVAVDYEENIAAGLQLLEETWNQLYDAGITANGGDPRYLENWYFAAWAYNTGIQPTAAFGNTSGCTPSPSCAGPDGTWGLGWSNNPQNPAYSPSRGNYLQTTYADAEHPSSWPYQERIMGWMGSPIIRYGYVAYPTPDYHGGASWLQVPAPSNFCDLTKNDCSTSASGYCTLSDSECWWHYPVTWVSNCSTTCATSAYQYGSGSSEPANLASPHPPTCNLDSSKVPSTSSGSPVIVDDLSNPVDNRQGCSGMNWSNNGTFTMSPGTNSSGDPVGDIDLHQLGAGFGGHILFTHTEPASTTSLIDTGTWTPNLSSTAQYYTVKIHLPATGAAATDVVYTINPGGGVSPWRIRVNQDWGSEQWVTIGTFAMSNGGNVQLTNASNMEAGEYDVAFDAVAFIPQGGTPGQPIGGPPGIQDAPKGSNPAWVNCGCATRTAGDPVDTATGYFGETATDIATPGLGVALSVTRSYASAQAGVNGPFGHGWTYSYGMAASTDGAGNVVITQEDASQVGFTVDGSGNYTPTAPRFNATLTKSGTTYKYVRRGRGEFDFDVTTGRLITEFDQAGLVASPQYSTSLAYDGSGHLHTVTDPGGRAYTFTWTGAHITAVTTPSQEVDYAYDGNGNLSDVYGVGTTRTGGVDGDQDHTRYFYDSSNRMDQEVNPANYPKSGQPSTTMLYDSSGRVTSQTDPDGKTTTFNYGPNATLGLAAGQTLVTDPVGHKTLHSYVNGLLASETKGYGSSDAETTSYQYDPVSLGVSVQTNPDGSTQTYSYDQYGNQISASDGLGRTTTKLFDAAGRILETINPDLTQTAYTYNAAGAVTQTSLLKPGQTAETPIQGQTDPTVRTTSYAYTDTAHPAEATSSTDARGKTNQYSYDSDGDLTSRTDPTGDVTAYKYDTVRGLRTVIVSPRGSAAGTTTSCTPPALGCTTLSYDAYGDKTSTTDANNHTASATFDATGHQLTSKDQNGHTTTYTFDADGRPTSVSLPAGDGTTTVYNDDGTVHTTSDAAGNVTTYSYDGQGRVKSTIDPDNQTTSLTYDANGNVKTVTKPSGVVLTQTWDSAAELLSQTYSSAAAPSVTFAYDLAGRRSTMTDGTGTTQYTYDPYGELSSVNNGTGTSVAYSYNPNGQVTSVLYPSAAAVTQRTYDDSGRLASVVDAANRTIGFGYDRDGDLTSISYPNGDTDSQTFDNADRIQTTGIANAGGSLAAFSYAEDADGSLTSETPSGGATGLAETFAYDNDERFTSTSDSSGTSTTGYNTADRPTTQSNATQTYDAAGQLCWSTTSSSSAGCGSPATGATTYSYNSNGDRTGKTPAAGTASTYGWNGADQLTSMSGPSSASYSYNGDGLRQQKVVGASTSTFTWDTTAGTPELLSDGNSDFIYGPNGILIEQSALDSSTPQYAVVDARNDVTLVLTSSGSIGGSYAYSGWGNVTSHTGTATTPLQWGQGYRDSENGFIYLQARYYDPGTAQFISVDPLVSSTLQAYLYGNNQPVDGLDPTGRSASSTDSLSYSLCGGPRTTAIAASTSRTQGGAAAQRSSSATSDQGIPWGAIGYGVVATAAGLIVGTLVTAAIAGLLCPETFGIGCAVGLAVGGAVGAFIGNWTASAIFGEKFDPLQSVIDGAASWTPW